MEPTITSCDSDLLVIGSATQTWGLDEMGVTIIAECGVSHNGSVDEALRMCDAAKEAGADIVKFQTYLPEIAIDKNSKDYDLLSSLALSFDDFLKIAKHCEDIGIEFMSTPDDLQSLKFLVDECGIKRIKIGSGSLTYTPLLEAAIKTKLPIILSTGMATEVEIEKALSDMWGEKFNAWGISRWDITLLHCVSLYPCPIELANINAIKKLKTFRYQVGYSDHTLSVVAIPCAAVALGATVIEKHFTLNRYAEGPDHAMSLGPYQFSEMVREIRATELALGDGCKTISEQEAAMIPRVRKGADGKQPGL